jgi:hypothetical protein
MAKAYKIPATPNGVEDPHAKLRASVCSRTINTSLVERRHATDRGRERTEVAADVPVQQGLAGA